MVLDSREFGYSTDDILLRQPHICYHMTRYLAGTDGEAASAAIGDHLAREVDEGDHVEIVHVMTTDDVEDIREGESALEQLAGRFEGMEVSVTAHQLNRGRKPAEELVAHAEEVDAEHIVTALRRHSRTERIIFGSVSHSLLQRVSQPVTLVPLTDYSPSG